MISSSKITLSQNNLKILRPKVTKNITNLCKKFCEEHFMFVIIFLLTDVSNPFSYCVIIALSQPTSQDKNLEPIL